jgi:uncharacterized protein
LNGTKDSSDAVIGELCPACGLCCNGVIFANVGLQRDSEATRLRSLGLPVRTPPTTLRPPHLTQPCAAFDGCRCRFYADRPHYCSEFECVLLKSVTAGRTGAAAALRIIRTARERADKVRSLLSDLGDTDELLPLSARFRRTGKRLQQGDLDEATADLYGQLTLAVHDLNLLLGDAFYPGSASQKPSAGRAGTAIALVGAALLLCGTAGRLQADQVEMQNGDHYTGHVVSLNTNVIVLQSDMLGTLSLPRAKVAGITLGSNPAANSPALAAQTNAQARASSATSANATAKPSPALRQLGANTNLIQQVQKQFLSDAGPEANGKFNELLSGLMSGKVSVDDIRAEAKTAADQLRKLRREGGEEAGFAVDAYLAILDHFLAETPPSKPATNPPASALRAKPAPAEKE